MPFGDVNSSESAEAFGSSGAGYEDDVQVAETPTESEADVTNTDGGEAQQTEWDGSKWVLKFRDQEIVPKSEQHLRDLAQKGVLFNHKDQELSQKLKAMTEREKALAEQEESLAEARQIQEAWSSSPETKQVLFDALQRLRDAEAAAESAPSGSQAEANGNAEVAALKQELQSLKQEMGTIGDHFSKEMNAKADAELASEMEALRDKYKDDDWTALSSENGLDLESEIYQYMEKNGVLDMEAAYRALRWDQHMANVKAQALREAAEKRQKASQNGVVSGEASTAPSGKEAPQLRDYREISDYVLRAGRITGDD